jgi:hypothetical protein
VTLRTYILKKAIYYEYGKLKQLRTSIGRGVLTKLLGFVHKHR